MKDSIRVALIQPKPYPAMEDPKNIGHALLLLQKFRGEKLDLICMPEYFPFQGDRELAGAARQLKSYLVAGLVEVQGNTYYNTATLFDRDGNILARQRKRHVGQLEREQMGMSPGDGLFRAVSTDFGKIGLPVCVDFWGQPEAGRQLADQGVDLVVNASTFPVLRGHWKTGAIVRAFDNFVPVIGVTTADYNAMIGGRRVHQHGGGSFIIQPPRMLDKDDFSRWFRGLDNIADWLQVELSELEQVHVADVNLQTARRFRREFWGRFGIDRR